MDGNTKASYFWDLIESGEDGISLLQADHENKQAEDLTLSIVTSRAKKTELRIKNMRAALSVEMNPEKRERLKKGIAEYEIRLDELKRIEAAAAKI